MSFAGIIRESLKGLNGSARSVLITVLLECNHSDDPNFILNNKIFPLKKGQWVASNKRISELTGLSRQQVRAGIKINQHLTSISTSTATSKATLYTIENPGKFLIKQKEQPAQQPAPHRLANQHSTTNNKETIISNKDKKDNKDEINIADFSEFWDLFPKVNRNKGSKSEAQTKFKIALKKDDFINIKIGLENYAKYITNIGQSNKDAFRWLEKEMWRDDWTIPAKTNGRATTSSSKYQQEIAAAMRGHEDFERGLPS